MGRGLRRGVGEDGVGEDRVVAAGLESAEGEGLGLEVGEDGVGEDGVVAEGLESVEGEGLEGDASGRGEAGPGVEPGEAFGEELWVEPGVGFGLGLESAPGEGEEGEVEGLEGSEPRKAAIWGRGEPGVLLGLASWAGKDGELEGVGLPVGLPEGSC